MTVFTLARKFSDNFFFERAKGRFAVGLENVDDDAACAGMYHFVLVDIITVQRLGDETANGSLARAHETDKREIDDAAVALHGFIESNFPLLDNF